VDLLDLLLERGYALVGTHVLDLSLEIGDPGPGLAAVEAVELGRRHVELGIPLATFLKGADILHEQLLEVLAQTTREPVVPPLQTGRFFAALRHHMARGYLELRLPEARLELSRLWAWKDAAAALDDAGRAALFGCLETILR